MHYLDYIPKLMPITSHNMIKMGGVIQGELTPSVLKFSDVINCFYLLENLHFVWYMHMYMTLDVSKIRPRSPLTALRSAVEIGGWGIYMLIIAPKHSVYRNWNLEILISKISLLVISKDITLMGRFLN